MPPSSTRPAMISAVLESVAVVARELMAGREPPFGRRMTRNQVDVLFILAHSAEPVTPRHLADGLEVTPGAITQLVDGLTGLGLVDSTAHPHDARSRVVRLTPAARSGVHGFERQAVQRMAYRFDGLTDEQLSALAASLSSVSEHCRGSGDGAQRRRGRSRHWSLETQGVNGSQPGGGPRQPDAEHHADQLEGQR